MEFNAEMHIENRALLYILYQRTRVDADSRFTRLCNRIGYRIPALYKLTVRLRSWVHASLIRSRFIKSVKEDYAVLKPHLPAVSSPVIVDIGCGLGGIDVLLSKHYSHRAIFTLVDKTQTEDTIWYGFAEKGAFYNDITIAKDLLIKNDVPAEHIRVFTPEEYAADTPPADIILSLKSLAFHYPLASYIDEIRKSLKPDGVLILDIRRDSEDMKYLNELFERVSVIDSDMKSERILASGKK